jgi:hypothetical protein
MILEFNNLKSDFMMKKEFFIKKTRAVAWAMALSVMAISFQGIAQDQAKPVFALLDFMKVKQGDEQKYIDLERNYWKKIHQERVKQGEIVRWVLYEVLYQGANDEYNFVTVAILNNPDKLEEPYAGIEVEKILAGEDIEKIMQETGDSRQLVKRNLITMVSTANDESGPAPFKYVQIDYMNVKPGNGSAYLDIENKVWKPVHQEFMNNGSRTGWALWQMIYPSGSGMEYQYATSNYIADFSKLMTINFTEAFNKAHPGGNTEKLMADTNKSRDLVRSELWRVIDGAQ